MNKTRRKWLEKTIATLEDQKLELESICEEEQEAYDNMPESLQESEKGQTMYENIDTKSRQPLPAISATHRNSSPSDFPNRQSGKSTTQRPSSSNTPTPPRMWARMSWMPSAITLTINFTKTKTI